MRSAVTFVSVLLAGCAVLIPDYNAKRHVWTQPDPHVSVQLIPFGPVCATERDEDGKWFRPTMVLIHVVELPPLPAIITLNKGAHRVTYAPGKVFVLHYKARVGLHRVDTNVGGHRAMRVLSVFRCKR